jgi:nicotinamidase-related amidase
MKTELFCYLEDRDAKRVPDTMDSWFDPDRTAIVCIDMHRGHLGTEPDVTCPAPRARDAIGAHDKLHRAARDLGIPVIMVQHRQRHGGIDDIRSRQAYWQGELAMAV